MRGIVQNYENFFPPELRSCVGAISISNIVSHPFTLMEPSPYHFTSDPFSEHSCVLGNSSFMSVVVKNKIRNEDRSLLTMLVITPGALDVFH